MTVSLLSLTLMDLLTTRKHSILLAVKYRYITELIHKKFMVLNYEPGNLLLPDIGTKPLAVGPFHVIAAQVLDFGGQQSFQAIIVTVD